MSQASTNPDLTAGNTCDADCCKTGTCATGSCASGCCSGTDNAAAESDHSALVEAATLYNQACGILEAQFEASLDDCELLLNESIRILESLPDMTPNAPIDQWGLLARALLLVGELNEWKHPLDALAKYAKAIEVDPNSREAVLQQGRLRYKLAATEDQLVEVEKTLKKAAFGDQWDQEYGQSEQAHKAREDKDSVNNAEGNDDDDSDSDSDDGDDNDTANEAKLLLGRLLCQSRGRNTEARKHLHSLGFKYRLAPDVLRPRTSQEEQQSSTPLAEEITQLRDRCVCVIDNALQPAQLAHAQDCFRQDAPFWREHGYGSPSCGFFSYQVSLQELQHSRTARKDNSIKKPQHEFHDIILDIWQAACTGMPHIRRAKFAEWWVHSRPHCNGHTMHFDYVLGSDGKERFPLASTVTFVQGTCGGPTLVTDQTMAKPIAQHGWVVRPRTNRTFIFNGEMLHCVLPGSGLGTPGDRRVTLMVAFWEQSPGAPQAPTSIADLESSQSQWPKHLAKSIVSAPSKVRLE